MKTHVKFKLYRTFQKRLVAPLLISRLVTPQRWRNRFEEKVNWNRMAKPSGRPRIWIHSASVGEFESVRTVIANLSKQPVDLILTVFSESAENALKGLVKEIWPQETESAVRPEKANPHALRYAADVEKALHEDFSEKKSTLLYAGYSPWEGQWLEALQGFRPDLFLTAKYEAWPELWYVLGQARVPLFIVGARARKSYQIAQKAVQLFGGTLPELTFCVSRSEEKAPLKKMFPDSTVLETGDPRWDRVMQRVCRGSKRVQDLISWVQERPVGVFGSLWMSDLFFLDSHLKNIIRNTGTIWFVPHHVSQDNLIAIEEHLRKMGIAVVRSSDLDKKGESPKLILVDEIGFLSELYSQADWAYVGGGFSDGLHNTIEPAMYGIPISGGPKRAERFSEVHDLTQWGQLHILRTKKDRDSFFDELNKGLWMRDAQKDHWIQNTLSKLEATQAVLEAIKSKLKEEESRCQF